MKNYFYIGSELELFADAINWKNYYSSLIQNHLGHEVLEVGAGIGSTTKRLCKGNQSSWTCLEPDPVLANKIELLIAHKELPNCCVARVGTLSSLANKDIFDTLIYIDVLEHIENDKDELEIANNHLLNYGKLIILSPAHQWLFTSFDKVIGHYRRYNKKSLLSIIPKNFTCLTINYIDSLGMIASLGNKFILRKRMPSKQQIMVWDKIIVPISRVTDPKIQYLIGKSILGVWQKKA